MPFRRNSLLGNDRKSKILQTIDFAFTFSLPMPANFYYPSASFRAKFC
jgi:hypothetical protein